MSRLDTGYGAVIGFSAATGVLLYEKQITPPSVQGGGKIDTTTHRNTSLRTGKPKSLKEMGDMSVTVAYDPAILTTMFSMINVNQEITLTFPDDSTWTFWGWIDTFVPGSLDVNEDQPTATVTIICSNQNASGVETSPAYAAAPA